MKNKKVEKYFLNALGIFFLLLGIVAIIFSIYIGRIEQVVWLCYIGLVLIGIGVLFRKDILITSQLNILIIPFIVWNVDFFYHLISGSSLWGITDYFFIENRMVIANLITLQHVFTIPLSLLALYFIKISRKDYWKFSFAEVSILFVFGRLFTSEETNMNCVYKPCFDLNVQAYEFLWFISFFAMIILTNYALNSIKILRKAN